MIELAFLACLSAMPDACEERSLYYSDLTPMSCLMGAQPELAKWVVEHPRYRVARWSCRLKDPSEQDA
ncbi:hypothetical protein LAZ40_03850 [Cereibacter sphaeroides]|uniref:hypothetical protein n=1 Tax=Rhodobacterales TaxID=204455 RepID=UPI000BBE210D|nr:MULTISPECIES: hypothetical protein [Paracoccaceae]MCE6958186.1 hypothetical protein [Cereibacter sphaeroides]MCE6968005.1 hypothetical protein [Cereibacter sphaeroides]MCE6972289.1 hypothetical protein [Cereibacter sphaeroides]